MCCNLGHPRFRGFLKKTCRTWVKVFRALAKFGAPIQDQSPAAFAEEGNIFQIGVAPCRIDIITQISGGIIFSEAFSKADRLELGEVTLPIISIDHLIKNKLATGRRKDLEDAKLLKQTHS
jgi:hypothetical protein